MGHGPRGLQRKGRRLELLHARSGARAGLSLGRRRFGRHFRRSAATLLRVALWNGKDAILKERLFGLTNSESNHGEDVKEYYFYLDSTPTHSYMKYLYKYPQAAFPYVDLVETSRGAVATNTSTNYSIPASSTRTATSMCSLSTRRQSPEEVLIQITVHNRGPEAAEMHVLPTLWFRNQWSWHNRSPRPSLKLVTATKEFRFVQAVDEELGDRYLYCDRRCAPVVHRERNKYASDLRRCQSCSLRQGRLRQLCRPWPDCRGESSANGHQSRAPLIALQIAAGRSAGSAAADECSTICWRKWQIELVPLATHSTQQSTRDAVNATNSIRQSLPQSSPPMKRM
jgi:hypothetical protein